MKATVLICLCQSLFAFAARSADASDALAATVQPYLDRHQAAGVVALVAIGDKVIERAAGFANLEKKAPMEPDALFWIASMTKPITATALMMLADEGKLSVDDPVEKYLPEFRGLRVSTAPASEEEPVHVSPSSATVQASRPILIREILSHTSGLERYSDLERFDARFHAGAFPEHQPGPLDAFPLAEAVKGYAAMPLRTQPGTVFRYSNAGINTAGRIVEVVSGMPYEKFLQERIFNPLRMTDTAFVPTPEQLKRLATVYALADDKASLKPFTLYQLHPPLDESKTRFPMPAGGLFSTAKDMLRFCQMVLNGGVFEGKHLLSTQAVKTMTSRQTGLKNEYGFGWYTTPKGAFSHAGGDKTNMFIDPAQNLIVILMEQISGDWPTVDGIKIVDALNSTAENLAKSPVP